MNKYALYLLYLHLPINFAVAYWFETNRLVAAIGTLLIALGPTALYLLKPDAKLTSVSLGSALMLMSGLIIHLARGMIEYHFHVFVALAATTIFGYWVVPIVAAATIAAQHLGFFFLFPESVFNYPASVWIVSLHAVFVVVETIPVTYLSVVFGRFIKAQDLVVGELAKNVKSLEDAAAMLAKSSESTAATTTEQSAAVHETGTALTQMKAMITQTADHVHDTSEIARTVQAQTEAGSEIMKQLASNLESIQGSNQQLQEILNRVEEISKKTRVINSIVQKTEMLSFNASIEAARAGQYGRGFAVVSEEVGKLAQMSGAAARDIESLIDESKKYVSEIIKTVQERATEGRSVGDESIQRYKQIESNIHSILLRVQNISEATREQELGVEQSVQAMHQLDAVAQKTARSAQDFKGLSVRLAKHASSLKSIYDQTRALVIGKSVEDSSHIPKNDPKEASAEFRASNKLVQSQESSEKSAA